MKREAHSSNPSPQPDDPVARAADPVAHAAHLVAQIGDIGAHPAGSVACEAGVLAHSCNPVARADDQRSQSDSTADAIRDWRSSTANRHPDPRRNGTANGDAGDTVPLCGCGTRRPRVLAVASGGGHWVQLLRLKDAFDGCDVLYVAAGRGYSADVPGARFRSIPDASRWSKTRLLCMGLKLAWIMTRFWPHVVVTTGAAPGYFAIRIGKVMRARTLWIDSIANAEEMSLSGRMAREHADLCLTQWPELAEPKGPKYEGAVLDLPDSRNSVAL